MIVVVVILKLIIPVNYGSKMSCVLYVGINAVVGGLVYIVVAYKMGLVQKVLGKRMTSNIIKKLTFGKISI